MNIADLKAELFGANAATYSAMTDAEVVEYWKITDAPEITLDSLAGSALFDVTVEAEYNALTDAKKQQWLSICGIDSVSKNAVPLIKDIFPSGTATWTAIVAASKETKKYIDVLGTPNEGDVRKARNS